MASKFEKAIDKLVDQMLDDPDLDGEIDKAADEIFDGKSMVDVLENLWKTTLSMFFDKLLGRGGTSDNESDIITIEDKKGE